MNQQEKKKFPLIAALLSSKVLKQLNGDSRNPMPSFVIRGHESMAVTLNISANSDHWFWIECEGDALRDGNIYDEVRALIALTHYTFESTRDYAAGWLAAQHPLLAENIQGAPIPTKPAKLECIRCGKVLPSEGRKNLEGYCDFKDCPKCNPPRRQRVGFMRPDSNASFRTVLSTRRTPIRHSDY